MISQFFDIFSLDFSPFQTHWVFRPTLSQLGWKKTEIMWENVKNLPNHVVARRFHNEIKPWKTFHCELNWKRKCVSHSKYLNVNIVTPVKNTLKKSKIQTNHYSKHLLAFSIYICRKKNTNYISNGLTYNSINSKNSCALLQCTVECFAMFSQRNKTSRNIPLCNVFNWSHSKNLM